MAANKPRECSTCDCSYTMQYTNKEVMYCVHPDASYRSINNKTLPRQTSDVRSDPDMCGPKAVWWEAAKYGTAISTIVRPVRSSLNGQSSGGIVAPQYGAQTAPMRRAPPYKPTTDQE